MLLSRQTRPLRRTVPPVLQRLDVTGDRGDLCRREFSSERRHFALSVSYQPDGLRRTGAARDIARIDLSAGCRLRFPIRAVATCTVLDIERTRAGSGLDRRNRRLSRIGEC